MKDKTHKTYSKLWLILTLAALLLLFNLPTVLAGDARAAEIVHIKSDEVIADDLYVSGQQIIIDGTVEGDVIAMGQSVIINGTIEGDLLAMAQVVTVNGDIQDDFRGMAESLVINGRVGDDVTGGGFNVQSGPESAIGGDLLVGAYQVQVEGDVAGAIKGGFARMMLAGSVGGIVDVEVGGDDAGPSPVEFMRNIPNTPPMPVVPAGLTVADTAVVGGQLTYRSPVPGNIESTAVSGGVNFVQVQQKEKAAESSNIGGWVWGQLQWLLRLLLVGALVIWIAPQFIGQADQKLRANWAVNLGWGALVFLIGFPLVLLALGILSFLTGFSILVFGTVLFGYLFVFFYLGGIVVAQPLGRVVLHQTMPGREDSLSWVTMVGLAILWLITVVPFLGPLVGFVVALLGTGSLLAAGGDRLKTAPANSLAASTTV